MDYTDYIKFVAALILVLGMMGGLAFVLKKLGFGHGSGINTGKRRMKLIEVLNIDTKNKAAIIECDDNQHLVLLNANNASIIESDIKKPAENK